MATGRWIVSVSAPVDKDGQFLGVVAVTCFTATVFALTLIIIRDLEGALRVRPEVERVGCDCESWMLTTDCWESCSGSAPAAAAAPSSCLPARF